MVQIYRFLKVEHAGESFHAKYNRLERKHKNQMNRAERFFLIIKDVENEYKTDRRNFKNVQCCQFL